MRRLLTFLTFCALALSVGCGASPTAPDASPSPSPAATPAPQADYLVTVVATQGGGGVVTQVDAGSTFKTSVTGVTCLVGGAAVDCPVFGGYRWRQLNVPLGLCSDQGATDSAVAQWACYAATLPNTVEIEGCVLDFHQTLLGCAVYKVGIK